MKIAIKTAFVLSVVCSAGSLPARCIETMSSVMQKRPTGVTILHFSGWLKGFVRAWKAGRKASCAPRKVSPWTGYADERHVSEYVLTRLFVLVVDGGKASRSYEHQLRPATD